MQLSTSWRLNLPGLNLVTRLNVVVLSVFQISVVW